MFCRVAPFAHTSHARTDVPHPRALTQRSATSGTTASHPASWEDPRSPVLICHRLHGRAVGARACTLRRDEPPTFLSEATPLTLSDCLDQTSRGHRKLPHQSTYSIECAHLGVGLKRLPPCASAVAAPLDQELARERPRAQQSTCLRWFDMPTHSPTFCRWCFEVGGYHPCLVCHAALLESLVQLHKHCVGGCSCVRPGPAAHLCRRFRGDGLFCDMASVTSLSGSS